MDETDRWLTTLMQSDTSHYGVAIEIYATQEPSQGGPLATWPLIGACRSWRLAGPIIFEIQLIYSNDHLT